MRFGTLRSIAHNLGDSIASGLGLPIGLYGYDVFAEARASAEGYVEIDFMKGEMRGAMPSNVMSEAILRYLDWLSILAAKHGGSVGDFADLTIRFIDASPYGPHFVVTVASSKERRDTTVYHGHGGLTLARTAATGTLG
ncbi:hypothetical protein ASD79_14845 [Caulobacter sp. Root655]|uniref:hypothetical protein n=1 Tax=Caulobacter sp. Root655 TaxID=1736578 RepID=UPI0006F2C7DB|nr:hypothetical protein [Caulobacter sp. Root655]KRA58563.1 hypothetical protein ASD79_14845 [Caulobacter sp. Root655]